MKTKLTVCALFLAAFTSINSQAATWGVTELLTASKAATEHFREVSGETLFTSITGVAVELNSQKVAAKAKITYKDNGVVTTANYFCHEHGEEIDCH